METNEKDIALLEIGAYFDEKTVKKALSKFEMTVEEFEKEFSNFDIGDKLVIDLANALENIKKKFKNFKTSDIQLDLIKSLTQGIKNKNIKDIENGIDSFVKKIETLSNIPPKDRPLIELLSETELNATIKKYDDVLKKQEKFNREKQKLEKEIYEEKPDSIKYLYKKYNIPTKETGNTQIIDNISKEADLSDIQKETLKNYSYLLSLFDEISKSEPEKGTLSMVKYSKELLSIVEEIKKIQGDELFKDENIKNLFSDSNREDKISKINKKNTVENARETYLEKGLSNFQKSLDKLNLDYKEYITKNAKESIDKLEKVKEKIKEVEEVNQKLQNSLQKETKKDDSLNKFLNKYSNSLNDFDKIIEKIYGLYDAIDRLSYTGRKVPSNVGKAYMFLYSQYSELVKKTKDAKFDEQLKDMYEMLLLNDKTLTNFNKELGKLKDSDIIPDNIETANDSIQEYVGNLEKAQGIVSNIPKESSGNTIIENTQEPYQKEPTIENQKKEAILSPTLSETFKQDAEKLVSDLNLEGTIKIVPDNNSLETFKEKIENAISSIETGIPVDNKTGISIPTDHQNSVDKSRQAMDTASTSEVASLGKIEDEVYKVADAFDSKTESIENEKTAMSDSSASEISDLESVERKVIDLKDSIEKKTNSITEEKIAMEIAAKSEIENVNKIIESVNNLKEHFKDIIDNPLKLDFDFNNVEADKNIISAVNALKDSLNNLDVSNINSLLQAFTGTKINKKNLENINKISEAIVKLKNDLNNSGNAENKFLSDISNIVSKTDELSNLLKFVSTSTKKEREEIKKSVNSENRDAYNRQKTKLKKIGSRLDFSLLDEFEDAKEEFEEAYKDLKDIENADFNIDKFNEVTDQIIDDFAKIRKAFDDEKKANELYKKSLEKLNNLNDNTIEVIQPNYEETKGKLEEIFESLKDQSNSFNTDDYKQEEKNILSSFRKIKKEATDTQKDIKNTYENSIKVLDETNNKSLSDISEKYKKAKNELNSLYDDLNNKKITADIFKTNASDVVENFKKEEKEATEYLKNINKIYSDYKKKIESKNEKILSSLLGNDNQVKLENYYNEAIDPTKSLDADEFKQKAEGIIDSLEALIQETNYYNSILKENKKLAETFDLLSEGKDNKPENYIKELKKIEDIINGIKNMDIEDIRKKIKDEDEDYFKKIHESLRKDIQLLKEMNSTANQKQIGNYLSSITLYKKQNTKLTSEQVAQLDSLIATLRKVGLTQGELNKVAESFGKIKSEVNDAGKAGKSFASIFDEKVIYRWAAQLGSLFGINDIIRYMGNGFEVIRELDTAMVDLSKTTKMTSSEMENFYIDSTKIGKQLGVTTDEVINQASAWSRLGYNTKEASTEMAKLSSKFASISPDMDVDTATSGLVSIMKAFKIDTDDVERNIMDNINTLGNNFAVTNGNIVDGLQRSASAMAAMGQSFEDTTALFVGGMEILQDAESMGSALRTIALRVRGYDEETNELSEDLTNITGEVAELTKTVQHSQAISLFTDDTQQHYKSMVQYLGELSDRWDEISEKNQTNFCLYVPKCA